MERRFGLPIVAIVALLALTRSLISVAAEEALPPGTIATVAGTGPAGFSGDNGPATQARLNYPIGVVIDAAGNLFFADGLNGRLRKVSPTGVITTIAGTGAAGFSGDGGPATAARLYHPTFMALDGAPGVRPPRRAFGTPRLYFSQWNQHRVRKVTPDGIITTVAGSGPSAIDGPGAFSGDGGPATAARLDTPEGLAVDAAGNLFIADNGNHRIRKVSPDGTITTVAGSGPTGSGKGVRAGDGGPALAARLKGPLGLALDGAGNLFFTDVDPSEAASTCWVRKMSAGGTISTVAGMGEPGFSGDRGPATEARLSNPIGIAVDTAGNLFIADWSNYRVRKVDPSGIITTVAGTGKNRYAGDGVPATTTGLRGPNTVAVDAAGNLLICDTGNDKSDGLGYNERVLKVIGVAAPGLLVGAPLPASR